VLFKEGVDNDDYNFFFSIFQIYTFLKLFLFIKKTFRIRYSFNKNFCFEVFKMTTTVETDLTHQLETSSLEAAKNEIPIGKDAADMIKSQANEAFKSKISFISIKN